MTMWACYSDIIVLLNWQVPCGGVPPLNLHRSPHNGRSQLLLRREVTSRFLTSNVVPYLCLHIAMHQVINTKLCVRLTSNANNKQHCPQRVTVIIWWFSIHPSVRVVVQIRLDIMCSLSPAWVPRWTERSGEPEALQSHSRWTMMTNARWLMVLVTNFDL